VKIEKIFPSETLVDLLPCTWRYTPRDRPLFNPIIIIIIIIVIIITIIRERGNVVG
jgi:hypothetical protein